MVHKRTWVCGGYATGPMLLLLGPIAFQRKTVMRRLCDGQLSPWPCDLASGPPISAIGSCYNLTTHVNQDFQNKMGMRQVCDRQLSPWRPASGPSTCGIGPQRWVCDGYATRPKLLLLGPGAFQSKTVMRRVCDGQLSPWPRNPASGPPIPGLGPQKYLGMRRVCDRGKAPLIWSWPLDTSIATPICTRCCKLIMRRHMRPIYIYTFF